MAGWNADTLAGSAGVGAVTIVEGAAFCISEPNGDIDPHRPQGVFFRDTRILSKSVLLVDGEPVEPLSNETPAPFRAVYLARPAPSGGRADTPLVIERERRVARGMREDIAVHNYSGTPMQCTVEWELEADFADIFDVKERRQHHLSRAMSRMVGERLELSRIGNPGRSLLIRAPGARLGDSRLSYAVTVPAHGTWSQRLHFAPVVDGEEIMTAFPADEPLGQSVPDRRLEAWQAQVPTPRLGSESVENVLHRSHDDLGSLRMFDPDHPERATVAAGAPWFMALFGRDSILTSLMALPVDSSLALGTLQTLAGLQGSKVDRLTEEQPGRILHEVRLGVTSGLALGGGSAYYGTVDATPLFVVALGELARWGLDQEHVLALLPHADRALHWIEEFGDRDGDGFIEYERLNDHGLVNQGWKDSWDGIQFADGTLAEPPIAMCEVQGYVYSAYIARAMLARTTGEPDAAEHWVQKARALKQQFNERFWMPERGYFALALDENKDQVDACASNMGHCLWSGIVDEDKAPLVAQRLMSPSMFSGWGIRTLAADMIGYNPVSYHCGTVWPHDNAIIAAGLMRYGFAEEAQRVAKAILDAAIAFGGRLPELFCGFDRDRFAEPVTYPSSCSPQAWAAGAPLLLLRTLLRLDPCVPAGGIWIAPVVPPEYGDVLVENLPLAGARLSIAISGENVTVSGLPDRVTLHREPRLLDADLSVLAS